MATILLSAAGAAIGAGFGGTVLGLSGAVIGRAIGATIGRSIDQRVLGSGSDAVDVGRVERFRMMGASEGATIPKVWGRVRVSGQVIWATRFQETVTRTNSGGKGSARGSTNEFSYSVSLAIAFCEGAITTLGRVWADGAEIAPDDLNLRVYHGSESQLPDPKIEAVEGVGKAPSYRGTAYVVIEDLDLAAYGNRVPQFSFEVIRSAVGNSATTYKNLAKTIPGVCLIPGTGEYSLATTAVHYVLGPGSNRSANVNSTSGKTDFATSLEHLDTELPNCAAVSIVVSWFGNDLRCASCEVRPKVEQIINDGVGMPWQVSSLPRAGALEVPKIDGRSVYGGTPTDQAVIEAIRATKAKGKAVTFYPFILMEQLTGNTLPDPWTGQSGQPALPWRGRVTLNTAPGQVGTADRTAAATTEVNSFFGTAQPSHFSVVGGAVTYSGPTEWRYRRFILHYANLCAAAGGVAAFCIGSEMRSLTQIRGASDSFPAVTALRQLAAEVKAILGAATKITYAADWSEYFGHRANNNVYFHLDPLWADPAIDFIGIDNYMPISDWRDGDDHADASWGSIYNKDYLRANIAGGEGFDWYYDGAEGEAAQLRKPIVDLTYGEDWIYRFKDLKGWWNNAHYNRINGVRQTVATGWVPGSKPFRFTEFGCAAIDRGSNEPNKFLDPKSSESGLPKYSTGLRDDLMQMAYYQAMYQHWTDPVQNPTAVLFSGRMLDFANSLAWAWDARPFPAFPRNLPIWSDGDSYDKGHWLNGRSSGQQLAAVIGEICETAGVDALDLSKTYGLIRGYTVSDVGTARAALQPLMLAYPTEGVEREGKLQFQQRTGKVMHVLDVAELAVSSELGGTVERTRSADVEQAKHLRLSYLEAETDFGVTTADAVYPDASGDIVSQSELPLVLTPSEANSIAERWMAEAQVSRDTARFALPRSKMAIGAGDAVQLGGQLYRIDRIEQSELQMIEAVRVDPNVYRPSQLAVPARGWNPYAAALPVYPVFLDLPLISGTEVDHTPHACVAANPWPGPVAIWASASDDSYLLNKTLTRPAVVGTTLTTLAAAEPGRWDRGAALRVRIEAGALASASEAAVLSGVNVAAIGDGSANRWELVQFVTATLVAPQTYDLSLRLRGQAGSDGIMPTVWPIGSMFVLISSAVQQIDLPISSRGLDRYYRFGAQDKGYADPNAVVQVKAFDGIGLRPYPVAHLSAALAVDGAVNIKWIRRTRIDGDSWQSIEVPLGEETEAYVVQVKQGATLIREMQISAPNWSYTTAQQISDAASGAVTFSVAQVSGRFGSGPFKSTSISL